MGQLLYHCLKRKNMVKINDLMKIEKSLLEINTNHKFELPFDDFISLTNMLKDIGRITNYYFYLQQVYYDTYQDKDKLEEYQKSLKNDDLSYNTDQANEFLEKYKYLL